MREESWAKNSFVTHRETRDLPMVTYFNEQFLVVLALACFAIHRCPAIWLAVVVVVVFGFIIIHLNRQIKLKRDQANPAKIRKK